MEATPAEGANQHQCSICSRTFGNRGGLVMHERSCSRQAEIASATPAKRPKPGEEDLVHESQLNTDKKGKSRQEPKDSDQEPLAKLKASPKFQAKKRGRPKKPKIAKKKKRPPGRPKKVQELQDLDEVAEKLEEQEAWEKLEEVNRPQDFSGSIGGAQPTIFIRGMEPPRSLVPSDARVRKIPNKKPLVAPREIHKNTMEAAEVEGLQAPEAWLGLGELPPDLPADFRSLLVLGPSGSGKSTLLRALLAKFFPDYQGPLYPCGDWPQGRAIIEKFDSAEQGRACLTSVGLSSVPTWCKPYEVLSVGERYRANLALALQQRESNPGVPLVFDEWTSELDRDLAKVVSVAFSKRMRREWIKKMPEGKSTTKAENSNEESEVKAKEVKEELLENAREELAGAKMEDSDGVEIQVQDVQDQVEEDQEMGEAEDEEAGEEENCEDDPLVEERREVGQALEEKEKLQQEDAIRFLEHPGDSQPLEETQNMNQEKQKDNEEAEEADMTTPRAPYIFASCHEDILNYLQPQFIIFCESGALPRLIKNPKAGTLPTLSSHLQGVTEPIGHYLVGSWMPTTKKITPFIITHKGSVRPKIFKCRFEGGHHVDNLEGTPDGSYIGKILPTNKRVRFTVLGPKRMEIQLEEDGKSFGKVIKANRRRMLAPHQTLALVEDPDVVIRQKSMNYSDCQSHVFASSGWYLPPEWGRDSLYRDLRRRGNPEVVRTMDFRFDAKLEQVDDNQKHLATYVGEVDGTLGEALQNVSKLLDCPFSGLCTHRLDSFKLPDFQLGVITGPSGSGKSTLVKDMFGASPSILWLPNEPVLGHFASLDIATDLLDAAALDLDTAMRPYESLSGGEQARAHMARVLALDPARVLILDEFTSVVDRPTAKKMARGLQKLIKSRKLTAKIVVVSCHSDFVGRSFLEPDWLFETHNHRLLHFEGREFSSSQRAKAAPLEKKLQDAKDKAAQAETEMEAFKRCVVQHAGHACFSPSYRGGVAAFAGALQVLSTQEVALRKNEVSALESELKQLHEDLSKIQEPDDGEEQIIAAPSSMPMAMPTVPEMQLEIRRALPREWVGFRAHHYKDKSLAGNAVTFVGLLNGRACCFCAIVTESANWIQKNVAKAKAGVTHLEEWGKIGYPTAFLTKKNRRLFREHRTVVLPDFQGMGLASLICDTLAVAMHGMNCDFTSQSVHPFYGSYRDRSDFWRALPTNRNEKSVLKGNLKYSHVFVGASCPDGSVDAGLDRRLRHRVMLSKNQNSVLFQKDIPELS